MISNCGVLTEKVSEFLDSHLKTIMQESLSYIKDPGDFINKISQIGDIPENVILKTADVVGLYPNIPQKIGLKALKNALEKREQKHIVFTFRLDITRFLHQGKFFNPQNSFTVFYHQPYTFFHFPPSNHTLNGTGN